MKKYRLLVALAALALVLAACTTGGEDDPDTTEASDTTQADAGGEGDGGDDGSGAILDAVLDRGTVRCGVNDVLPGFGIVDDAGEYSGFDVDFCRAVAAGVRTRSSSFR